MKGVLGADVPKDEIEAIIRSVDADDSGTIDLDEFLTLMSDPRFNDPTKDEHREVFKMFDKDGNGQISVAELKEAFRNLGEFTGTPPTAKFHQLIRDLLQAKNWMTMSWMLSWKWPTLTETGISTMRNSSWYVQTPGFALLARKLMDSYQMMKP